jgi:hypothetical protein
VDSNRAAKARKAGAKSLPFNWCPGAQKDTRARAAMPTDRTQREIIEQFAGPRTRLLVTGWDRAKRPTVEVAHEALIRTWPRPALFGGLALGTLFGIAAASPLPVYYAEPVYPPSCYWTRGRPVWDGYRGVWIIPRIQVCDEEGFSPKVRDSSPRG